MKIELGSLVRDVVSGYEGIAIGHCLWLTGCDQYIVKPKGTDKDGGTHKGEWFDLQRLKVLEPPTAEMRAVLNPPADVPHGGEQSYPEINR